MSHATVPNKGKLIIAAVKKALYDWVRTQCAGDIPQNQILWRDQSEPLPPRPCVTLRITSGPQRVGYQDNIQPQADGRLNMGGQRTMIVSVQVFGNLKVHRPMAYQLAADLNASLSKQTVLMELRRSGVAIQNQGEVTNLTDLEESEFEERAEFSMQLGVAENVLDDPGTIENVNIPPLA
jgi:hypothetical protein